MSTRALILGALTALLGCAGQRDEPGHPWMGDAVERPVHAREPASLHDVPRSEERRACKRGDAQACRHAGIRFALGIGGPVNIAAARSLLDRACALGERRACRWDPETAPRDALDVLRPVSTPSPTLTGARGPVYDLPVVVEFCVAPEGHTRDLKAIRSAGPLTTERVALAAVERWRFAVRRSQLPVCTRVTVDIPDAPAPARLDPEEVSAWSPETRLEQAKALYMESIQLRNEEAWGAAAVRLEEAYSLVPDKHRFACEIGKALDRYGDCGRARPYLQLCLIKIDHDDNEDLITEVRGILRESERCTGA